MFFVCVVVGVFLKSAYCSVNVDDVFVLFDNASDPSGRVADVQQAFDKAYKTYNDSFDFAAFEQAAAKFREGVTHYRGTDAYAAYSYFPDRPHCDVGVASSPRFVNEVSPFPGGITQKAFGSDLAKSVHDLAQQANGPASAGLVPLSVLSSQSLNLGMGVVQSAVAAMVHSVPPLVPPPAWNNQPLPCAPMVTGHNCFGAVLYPITMADFVIADVTDSMLDGVIAGFPNTYATKVGKTSDDMYKACFAAYMSMHCSSIFPRCTVPQARDEPIPLGGRAPMCLHLCIMPLVMCPGLWVDDIIGTCSMVSVPPLCTQAYFWNLWRLPPQYVDYDESHPFAKDCPVHSDEGMPTSGVSEIAKLYDVGPFLESPILKEAAAVKAAPVTRHQ